MPETRQFSSEQVRAVDQEKRRLTVVISTFDLDSYGTRIDQSGWDFDTFKKNPVIPLAHDDRGYTGSNGLPVAKGLPETIRVEGQRTYLTIQFPEPGVFPLADTVFELARSGFVNAVSVGFEPVEHEDVDEPDEEGNVRQVRVYRKQRLLEVSIVTIPSNSNALIQRAAKLNADPDVARRLTEQLEEQLGQEAIDPAEFRKYKGYFEKKQPANKASTKVLKAFYEKVLKEEAPENEVQAWERMGEAVEGMAEITPEPEPEPKPEGEAPAEVTPPEATPEETPAAAEIPAEPSPEPKPEDVKEESTPKSTPVPEAPEPARTASVQIPLHALSSLFRVATDACVDACEKASRRGIPRDDLPGVIDATARGLKASLIPKP